MDLIAYLKTLGRPEREDFAARCRTTLGHLNNVAYGYKPCGPELAVSIEQESGGQVCRPGLRPTDWPRLWPELIPRPHGAAGAECCRKADGTCQEVNR